MATVTGLTAARMLAIEAASVVDGDVVGDNLILTKQDGSQINAGNVRGPQGDQGPVGSDLEALSARDILEVGILDQIRAGRQLTASDFTNMGLSAPIGLYNLSNANDSSGNGRNLSNKGAVPFTEGINGEPSSAAQFAGLTSQALYINDSGASDPFRIRMGSVGAWFRTARNGVFQAIAGKYGGVAGQNAWWLQIALDNVIAFTTAPDGGTTGHQVLAGISNVCDNRWHFAVATYDGAIMRIYVDGVQEGFLNISSPLFAGSAPFTIGGLAANASTAAINPHLGRIDEVFVTSDILSLDQIRNLYCVKIPHSLASVPKRATLSVRRRKKGAALATSDFPTQPVRLYNFSAGSLADQGSNGQALTNSGGAVSAPGVDGSLGNAFSLVTGSAQQLIATDSGLPAGTNPRSYGLWFKQSSVQNSAALISWGSGAGSSSHTLWISGGGDITARTPSGAGVDMAGPFVSDGEWHFVVVTEENSPLDGGHRKMYVDGHYVVGSVTLAGIVLAGANRFRIGQWADGSGGGLPSFNGLVDSVFVCNYVLDAEDILALYAKGAQALGVSPKNAGDHVEAMTSTDLLCLFDTLPSQHQVDLAVA